MKKMLYNRPETVVVMLRLSSPITLDDLFTGSQREESKDPYAGAKESGDSFENDEEGGNMWSGTPNSGSIWGDETEEE